MNVMRPNGMVERLARKPRPLVEFDGYGRAQPGPAGPETLRIAAKQDRRKRPRRKPEPLRGRLVDVNA